MPTEQADGTFLRFFRRAPRQGRAKALVDALLDAAEQDLARAGTDGLQRVLERAGVAAGSFYEYFASRDGLMGALVGRVTTRNFDELLAETDLLIAGGATFEDVVRQGAAAVARRYLERPPNTRIIIDTIARLGLLESVHRHRDRFAAELAARAARFRPDVSDEARREAMRALSDAVTGVVVAALYRSPVPPRDEVGRVAGDVAWGIVATLLGPRSKPEDPRGQR